MFYVAHNCPPIPTHRSALILSILPSINPVHALSPRVLKAGIVLLNATTSAIERIIALQYNPGSLSRSLKGQTLDDANRSQALRLKGRQPKPTPSKRRSTQRTSWSSLIRTAK